MALIWFRYHAEALDNPRVQKLSGDLFKIWVNCQCILSQEGAAASGKMPSLEDCAYRLRMTVQDVEKSFDNLVEKGLMKSKYVTVGDGNGDESVTVGDGNASQKSLEIFSQKKEYFLKNWEKKQYKSDTSTERMKRHRQRHRDGKSDGLDQIRSEHNRSDQKGDDLLSEKEEKKKPTSAPSGDPVPRQKTYGGRYDILRHLSDREIEDCKAECIGWDFQYLANQYNDMVNCGRFLEPAKPQYAFPAWIKSFTKGKTP